MLIKGKLMCFKMFIKGFCVIEELFMGKKIEMINIEFKKKKIICYKVVLIVLGITLLVFLVFFIVILMIFVLVKVKMIVSIVEKIVVFLLGKNFLLLKWKLLKIELNLCK